MTSATVAQHQSKMFEMKKWMAGVGLFLLVIITTGLFTWYWYYTGNQSNLPPLVSQAEFEEFSGIHPKMIVVTAAGGIVDFRYKVVDAERAGKVMEDAQLLPRLIVEDSGLVLNSGAHHLFVLEVGKNYFLFYPNIGSAVKPGSELSILVGDTRFGPIVVK